MALIACAECGAEASTSAERCPRCGASPEVMAPRPPGAPRRWYQKKRNWLMGVVLLSVVVGGLLEKPKTPAQIAENKVEGHRLIVASLTLDSIKRSLRNPDSFKVDKLSVNKDGSTICVRYRAQNGFGGINVGHAVLANGGLSESAKAWNKHCANRSLDDLTRSIDYLPDVPRH